MLAKEHRSVGKASAPKTRSAADRSHRSSPAASFSSRPAPGPRAPDRLVQLAAIVNSGPATCGVGTDAPALGVPAVARRSTIRSAPAGRVVQRMTVGQTANLRRTFGSDTVDRVLVVLGQTAAEASFREVAGMCEHHAALFRNEALGAEDEMTHDTEGDPEFIAWLKTGAKPTVMNCWEFAFYITAQTGIISREEIRDAYLDEDFAGVEAGAAEEIFAGGALVDPAAPNLSVGDALVFGEVRRHVALSLGGKLVADLGTWNRPQVLPLEEVLASQRGNVAVIKDHAVRLLNEFATATEGGGDRPGAAQVQTVSDRLANYAGAAGGITDFVRAEAATAGMDGALETQMLLRLAIATNVRVYKVPLATWGDRLLARAQARGE